MWIAMKAIDIFIHWNDRIYHFEYMVILFCFCIYIFFLSLFSSTPPFVRCLVLFHFGFAFVYMSDCIVRMKHTFFIQVPLWLSYCLPFEFVADVSFCLLFLFLFSIHKKVSKWHPICIRPHKTAIKSKTRIERDWESINHSTPHHKR